jgi:predicted ABC-type exoprotein transport system permease subunit
MIFFFLVTLDVVSFVSPNQFMILHGNTHICPVYTDKTTRRVTICRVLAGFFTFVTFFEVVVMVITRAHYSIDMITGAIVASWIYMSCVRIEPYVQQLFGLPPRPILPDKNIQTKYESLP